MFNKGGKAHDHQEFNPDIAVKPSCAVAKFGQLCVELAFS